MTSPSRPLAAWRIGAVLLGAVATVLAGLYALSLGQYAAVATNQTGVSVAWSAEGQVVAFTTGGTAQRPLPAGRVYQLNLEQMTVRLLFEEDAPVSALVYSRDARRLAYAKQTGDGDVTVVRDIANGLSWNVRGPSKECKFPVLFTPDGRGIIETRSGRYLAHSRYPTSDWDIWLVDIETGEDRRLTELGLRGPIVPAYLPDGSGVVFVGEKRLKWIAYRVAVTEGAAVRKLAPVGEGASAVAPATIGDQLVFEQRQDYTVGELAALDLATGEVTRVCPRLTIRQPYTAYWGGSGNRMLILADMYDHYYSLSMIDYQLCRQYPIADRTLFDDPLHWKPSHKWRASAR